MPESPETRRQSDRTSQIFSATVAALQEVVREYQVTQDELHAAADYLTRAAHAGVLRSLLDSSLAMTIVDAVERPPRSTRPNAEGPYYRPGAPLRPDGSLLERSLSGSAELLRLQGRVLSAQTGLAIAEAVLDLWQADEYGKYDHEAFHLRGRVQCDDKGTYKVTTIVPNDYTEHDEDPIGELFRILGRRNYRAAHIHAKISVDGVERLTTQLFMGNSPHLTTDYVIGAVSPDLVIRPIGCDGGSVAHFDFYLDDPMPDLAREPREP